MLVEHKCFSFFIMFSKKNHLEKIGKGVKLSVKKLEKFKRKKEKSKKN